MDSAPTSDTAPAPDTAPVPDAAPSFPDAIPWDAAAATVWCDESTSLCWMDPSTEELFTWADAKAFCNNLVLDGHDDWRLPSLSELRSLIQGCAATEVGGSCGANDDCLGSGCADDSCYGCDQMAGPGTDGCYLNTNLQGTCFYHWSSSSWDNNSWDTFAWEVNFDTATVINHAKTTSGRVRCVRDQNG